LLYDIPEWDIIYYLVPCHLIVPAPAIVYAGSVPPSEAESENVSPSSVMVKTLPSDNVMVLLVALLEVLTIAIDLKPAGIDPVPADVIIVQQGL
jgi:hypothetical protein